ncbi:MAG: endolytic transglycosylase MltG [Clostridiales bacterium]|nr:endolytic transglycosylase MltG [Clostridiales bacterium]
MDNNLNHQENKNVRTKMDADGNLQIRSSSKRQPSAAGSQNTPDGSKTKRPVRAARAVKREAAPKGNVVKRTDPTKSNMQNKTTVKRKNPPALPKANDKPLKRPADHSAGPDGVEYSFTNSQLFNNGHTKLEGTAFSAAKAETPAPQPKDGQTKVLSLGKGAQNNEATRITPAVHMNRPVRKGANLKGPMPVKAGLTADNGGSRREGTLPAGEARTPGKTAPAPAFATKVNQAVKMPRVPKKPRKQRDTEPPDGAMNSISQAFIYIAAVLLTSIVLSYIVITNANDIFAFVKSDEECTLTIEAGTDLNQLADQLKKAGIIEHKLTFKIYIKYRGKDSDAYTPGTYTVSPSMNYDQLISAITPKVQRETVVITVPEGYTVQQIIDLFVEKGIGDREKFVDVIQNYDFDYWFMKDIPNNKDRYYRLEGYLFPDTYYFYTDMSEVTIINKFLDNFDKKYKEEYKTRADALHMTTDEVLTLASIIQAEGKEKIITLGEGDDTKTYVDYGLISKVFANRRAINMRLQSDATTLFALTMDKTGEEKVTGSNKNYKNPYNTYEIDGLPPGAICNPGLNAVSFALWPDDDAVTRQLYYFVSDAKGMTYFSKTLKEHEELTARINAE